MIGDRLLGLFGGMFILGSMQAYQVSASWNVAGPLGIIGLLFVFIPIPKDTAHD